MELDRLWQRYGLIAELAVRLEGRSPQFGKTVLQKLVYLLQEVYGLKCGYEFGLHNYGPFSPELLDDLDLAETVGAVTVNHVPTGTGGYRISEGTAAQHIRRKASAFLSEASEPLGRAIDEFGCLSAKELESISTIVYVDRDLGRHGTEARREEFVDLVSQIKPQFKRESIEERMAGLTAKRFTGRRD